MKPQRNIGIDLGQARDHTAIAVIDVTEHLTGETRTETHLKNMVPFGAQKEYQMEVPILERRHDLVHLERFPLGTTYPDQVARIKQLFVDLKDPGWWVQVVVDQTGVGRPVVDLLRPGLPVIPVIITGGDKATNEEGTWRVPKRDLVSSTQILLESGRLRIASGLPLAGTLVEELLGFKVNINARGHDRYGNDVGDWRENPHDDLVLATALACWWGERRIVSLPERRSVFWNYAG